MLFRSAAELKRRFGDIVAEESNLDGRLTVLAGLLSNDGYAATTVGPDDSGPQLCQHHCPVSHVAAEFPQLCEAETEAFESLLGTHVLRLATIAHGDGICTTLVPALMNRRTSA